MEIEILNAIQKIHFPLLDSLMIFFTSIGDYGFIWILLAFYLLLIKKHKESAFLLFSSFVLNFVLCNLLLKNLFSRIRPCDINPAINLLIAHPSGYSFPSGHTSASFTAVATLYYAKEKKLFPFAFLIAILISFSRLYLYVHYPTDILGGILIGILTGKITFLCLKKSDSSPYTLLRKTRK